MIEEALVAAVVVIIMLGLLRMAAWAGQYVYRLIVARNLDMAGTFVDLDAGVTSSIPITPQSIADEVGIGVERLTAAADRHPI